MFWCNRDQTSWKWRFEPVSDTSNGSKWVKTAVQSRGQVDIIKKAWKIIIAFGNQCCMTMYATGKPGGTPGTPGVQGCTPCGRSEQASVSLCRCSRGRCTSILWPLKIASRIARGGSRPPLGPQNAIYKNCKSISEATFEARGVTNSAGFIYTFSCFS